MKDAAGTPALQDAIRHLHGLESTWLESVAVHEEHEGETVWAGHMQAFDVDHPPTRRCYAWSHESGPGGRRRFHAVLGVGAGGLGRDGGQDGCDGGREAGGELAAIRHRW